MKEFLAESPDDNNETPPNFHELYPKTYGENFESRRTTLNKQYDHPEIIKIKENNKTTDTGKTIEVVDLKPDNQSEIVPMTYVKGFASKNNVYRNLAINIAMDGRRVIAMDNPHGIDSARITENEKQKAVEYLEKLHSIELRKAAMLMETLEQKGIEQTDIVAHSEGAIYAVITALMHPEKVRNMVLINPTGMIGPDKPLDLAKRSIDDLNLQSQNYAQMEAGIDPRQKYNPEKFIDPEKIKNTAKKAKEVGSKGMLTWISTWYSGPVKNLQAINAIAGTQIAFALQYLREEYGIKVAIIDSVDDQIYKTEHVQEDLSRRMVDSFITIQGTHTTFAHNPEKSARLINSTLKGLQLKRQNSEEYRPLDGFL